MSTNNLPVDGDHALLVGALVGSVMRSSDEMGFRYVARILDDEDGHHLAVFEVIAPSGKYLVRVEKVEKPEDEEEIGYYGAR